jgi:hypothetical protein
VLCHGFVKQARYVVDGDRAFGLHGKTLPGDDVLDVEQLQLPAVTGLVDLEVHGPNDVGSNRAHGPDVHPQPAQRLLALAIGDLQPESALS